MKESIDECIMNCLITERGSYPLFRGYGLAVTDQRGSIRRSQIQQQLSKYYPDIDGLEIKQTSMHDYTIRVTGFKTEGKR